MDDNPEIHDCLNVKTATSHNKRLRGRFVSFIREWKWFRPLANSPPTSSPRSNRVRLLCDEFAPLYILHYFASLFNRVRSQYI